MNETPYEKRAKEEQTKINNIMLLKAKDIREFASRRNNSKQNRLFNIKERK